MGEETTEPRQMEDGIVVNDVIGGSPDARRAKEMDASPGAIAAALEGTGIVPGPKLDLMFPEDVVDVEETPVDEPSEDGEVTEVSGEEAEGGEELAEETTELTPEGRTLSDDEMANTFLSMKVDGEAGQISLKDVRDNYQIAMGADKRLKEAADARSQYREEVERLRELQNQLLTVPKTPAQDTDLTYYDGSDQNPELVEMRKELSALQQQISGAEVNRLAAEEDNVIRGLVKDQLGTEDMGEVVKLAERVIENDPDFRNVASLIFDGSAPKNHEDMSRRLAFFKTFLIQAKNLELPTIVEKAKEEGKIEAKKERKLKLTTVDSTAPPPSKTRAEKIREASARGTQGMVELGEELIIDKLFPDLK